MIFKLKKSESDDKVQDTDSRKKIPKPSELTKYPTPSRNYVRKDYAPDEFAPAGNAFESQFSPELDNKSGKNNSQTTKMGRYYIFNGEVGCYG